MSIKRMALLVAAASLAANLAWAQEYPTRPIQLTVGATPGGSIDFAARVIAPPLAEILQTSVVVVNKPGASGVLNSEFVANSAPDGHTLMVGTPSPVVVAPQAMRNAKFNPLTDVAAINMVSTSPIAVAVNPRIGIKSVKDLVALARTRTITMGLPLAGSVSHLVTELVAEALGISFVNVPYKGAAPMMSDTIGGHVDAGVSDVGPFLAMHRDGRLKILFVTSEKRLDLIPEVQTVAEDVPGLVMTNWIGLFAPAKTPRPVLDKINAAIGKLITRDDVRAQFQKAIVTPATMPSIDAFQKFVAAEYERYGQVVRRKQITIE